MSDAAPERPGLAAQLAVGALARLLARNPWAMQRLVEFAGGSVRITLGSVSADFVIASDGGVLGQTLQGAPDVDISLPAAALKALADGPDAVFRQARIAGDAHFAETLGFVLRHLEWDAEEDLARWVGDPLARRMHLMGRALLAWGRQAAQNTGQNVQEFIVEEAQIVPSAAELTDFGHDVATLRDALARLSKRLERLERSPR